MIKTKILQFKDGRQAVSKGMFISVNKQEPIKEAFVDLEGERLKNALENPEAVIIADNRFNIVKDQ